jgi:glycosyltransferase involved in cell wall biosynthesis
VVPTTSPATLAERIIDLLRRPELRAQWGTANRQVIVERNNYAREMRKMEELYQALKTAGDEDAPRHGRSR